MKRELFTIRVYLVYLRLQARFCNKMYRERLYERKFVKEIHDDLLLQTNTSIKDVIN